MIHKIDVYNTGTLTATLSGLSTDLDVFILSNCDKTNCLAVGDFVATCAVTPGTYYIVVDGYVGHVGTYTLTVDCPPPPTVQYAQNQAVYNGVSWCWDATSDLNVAGWGSIFWVLSGGNADLIAGNSIHLYAGTVVAPGGHLHAQITDQYCGYYHPPAFIAVATNTTEDMNETQNNLEPLGSVTDKSINSSHFRVYPNPTTGKFKIEYTKPENDAEVKFQIFTLLGELVATPSVNIGGTIEVDLSAQNPGIYVIRMNTGVKPEYLKVVKY